MKCKKMELLLTSLTKLSVQELEKKDYRLDSRTTIDKVNEIRNDYDDNEDDDEVLSDISDMKSIDDDYNHNDSSMEDTLANLNLDDYDSLKYTGQSACFQLLDRNLFTSKNILHLPGREDVVFKLMPENELLVIRSNSGKRNTRLDVGFSLNSSIFDEKKNQDHHSLDTTMSKRTLPSEKLIEKAYHL